MKIEKHLGEEVLNMYLDGELSARERERVEVHLDACDKCRVEVAALQQLFAALEELASAPAPDLVPGVLTHIRPRRWLPSLSPTRLRPLWLVPALQAAAALALLIWGWTRLAGYWAIVVDILSPGALGKVWAEVAGWVAAQWVVLSTWPDAAWAVVQEWAARLAPFGDLRLSPTQLAVLGAALVALWLMSNAALLRGALLNGRAIQAQRRQ